METMVKEGSAKLKIPKSEKISKGMGVFYNPAMNMNRDISVLLLNSINKKNLQIADPLAATGVRSIRFLKELSKNKIKKIYINDCSKDAIYLIKQNLALNKIKYKNSRMRVSSEFAKARFRSLMSPNSLTIDGFFFLSP